LARTLFYDFPVTPFDGSSRREGPLCGSGPSFDGQSLAS
jgi:hypothetical protein